MSKLYRSSENEKEGSMPFYSDAIAPSSLADAEAAVAKNPGLIPTLLIPESQILIAPNFDLL
jgi:hypothetical protein